MDSIQCLYGEENDNERTSGVINMYWTVCHKCSNAKLLSTFAEKTRIILFYLWANKISSNEINAVNVGINSDETSNISIANIYLQFFKNKISTIIINIVFFFVHISR